MNKVDLHMHSSYSGDADLPVRDLIGLAKENDVSLLSITDHNSSKSVNEAIEYGKGII